MPLFFAWDALIYFLLCTNRGFYFSHEQQRVMLHKWEESANPRKNWRPSTYEELRPIWPTWVVLWIPKAKLQRGAGFLFSMAPWFGVWFRSDQAYHTCISTIYASCHLLYKRAGIVIVWTCMWDFWANSMHHCHTKCITSRIVVRPAFLNPD